MKPSFRFLPRPLLAVVEISFSRRAGHRTGRNTGGYGDPPYDTGGCGDSPYDTGGYGDPPYETGGCGDSPYKPGASISAKGGRDSAAFDKLRPRARRGNLAAGRTGKENRRIP